MKTKLTAAVTLTLAVAALALGLPSCTSPDQKATLAKWGNVAITAAEIGGQLNPKQAELIRNGGVLVLNLEGKDQDAQLAMLSEAAVAYAEAEGKLTTEQAAALRAAGQVPLTPTTPPLPTAAPPAPGK